MLIREPRVCRQAICLYTARAELQRDARRVDRSALLPTADSTIHPLPPGEGGVRARQSQGEGLPPLNGHALI
jgi:hypothetical protein